ncbi:MAG TPA: tRNA (N(6)-L-threonylcarbamoyladenosine(37)-C(2))-methylthiotransferase [Nanoarchaeota archaeon]|nr:tRNA (N(6)-L-threonylcarbamoyladenosine(37)-C(2))-methylthiotransferase [Nanoarchaeota archaeon]
MRIKLIAFGCSNNQAESEIMAGLLKEAGYEIVDAKADLTIVSMCNVKGPSFNKGLRAAKDAKGKVIISGCIPFSQIAKISKEIPRASIVSTHNICSIKNAVERLAKGERVELVGKKHSENLLSEAKGDFERKRENVCMPRIRKNKVIGIVPISSGCMGECSYCAVKAIKGELASYPVESIVKETEQCVKEGCKEIWLTAQDTGCYGTDIGKSLPELLNAVLTVPGDFKVRLGMANPNFVYGCVDEMVGIYKNPKMFRFMHIPVQSGSDNVLKKMNRHYTCAQFVEIVGKLRKAIPDITISTDIIVGFPEESDADFNESLDVIEKTKPSVLNLNRYWPMPETKAALMKQFRSEVLRERCSIMLKAFQRMALDEKKKAVGKELMVLIDDKVKGDSYIGRTDCYTPVGVKGKLVLGQMVRVKIVKATSNYLNGEKM